MSNAQKYNQSLIPCTKPQQVLTESKQSFEVFLKVFSDCGGTVNDTTVRLIKESIDKNQYSVEDIEKAVRMCFDEEQFFNWANITSKIRSEDALLDQKAIIRKKRREYASTN